MSSEDEYHTIETDPELVDFIVSDEPKLENEANDVDEPTDRLQAITTTLKPNETKTQKILKAHISVLVSALGGPDHTSSLIPVPYKLGHDALACLKDLKRWIKSVDDKLGSFDVALACSESGLVQNDLTVMLCQWDTQLSKNIAIKNARMTEKIMLADLELLVLLTWPTELTPESTEAQRLGFVNFRKSQIIWKKHILTFNKGQTLKSVIRLVLGTLSKDKSDRDTRDNNILRLVLFFIRNILYISPTTTSVSTKRPKELSHLNNMPNGVSLEDISLNHVLEVFKKNKVLLLLLTISNSLGSEFDNNVFGPCCLECINLIIKQVDVEDLLPGSKQSKSVNNVKSELNNLLQEESRRKKVQGQNLSTRHGRFGTLLSIQGDEQTYVVSGQEALASSNMTLEKLDRSKKWNKTSSFKYDSDQYTNNQKVYLNQKALEILKDFINLFLNGGCFNNLISAISSLLSSADDLTIIDPYENAVYFLTIGWFLNFTRQSIIHTNTTDGPTTDAITGDNEELGFTSINACLSQTNFILMLNYFRKSFEARDWNSVHVAMDCFLELLLVAHNLFLSDANDDDNEDSAKELGEGIIRNLFTSYDFLNVLVAIPQTASKHSPDYLKKCIHMVHILLKSFEAFTKENVTLYIKKRRRKLKKSGSSHDIEARLTYRLGDDLMEYSDEEVDEARAKEEKIERKLDLLRTEQRFFHTNTINSYIDYLREYEDLTQEEIKRCISYFHRLFVVNKDHQALFRLDFIYTIHKVRNSLSHCNLRQHIDDFIIYFMKKFKLMFSRFPNAIELLFPRFEDNEAKTFLSQGELFTKDQTTKSQPLLAKDIEFINDFDMDQKVKILITALFHQEKQDFISWLTKALETIVKQKVDHLVNHDPLNVTTNSIILTVPETFRRLVINNGYIRCLLSLVHFELPEILEDLCELPKLVTTAQIVELVELIKKWVSNQPVEFDDGKDAFFFMTTKDYYDGGEDFEYNDTDIAFETVGNSTKSSYLDQLDYLDDLESQISKSQASQPRGIARKKHRVTSKPSTKTVPKQGIATTSTLSIKSTEFIHDSDDDSDNDAEFFEREEKLRALLAQTGGIVNSTQLEEFKRVWSNIAHDNGAITETVSRAWQNATTSNDSESLASRDDKENQWPKRKYIDESDDEILHAKSSKKRLIVDDDD